MKHAPQSLRKSGATKRLSTSDEKPAASHARRRSARRADDRITLLELPSFSVEFFQPIGSVCTTSPHATLFRVCGLRGDVSAMGHAGLAQ
jgi:hypothetical protein